MGDAVEKFVCSCVDMVIDEMRQGAVDEQRPQAQNDQDETGIDQHVLWLPLGGELVKHS